jgi:hypothetical protein
MAIVQNGEVVNVIVADENTEIDGAIPVPDGVGCCSGWKWDGAQFAAPEVPIESRIYSKRAQIEIDRDAACEANATAHGRQWQADQRSQALLGQAITLASAGIPLPPVWRDADNNNMPITALSDLLEIAGSIAANVQAAYSQSWSRKAALEASTTKMEIEAV